MTEESLNTSADYFANSSSETVKEIDKKGLEFKKRSKIGDKYDHGSSCCPPDLEELFTRSTDYPDEPPPPFIDEEMEQSLLSCPNLSNVVDDIVKDNAAPSRICCPFCLVDFGFEELLKEHIKESHPRELKHVHRSRPGELEFYECPFCTAKFYSTKLLPKHIIHKHELCVLNMFSGFSPEKYVYCRFCPHKILRKHYKLLMIHIEKKHFSQFEKYVLLKYCHFSNSLEDLVGAGENPRDEIEKPFESKSQLPMSPRSILKPRTAYPLEVSEVPDVNIGRAIYSNLDPTGTRASPRRRIRFDLPETSGNKENKPGTKRKVLMPNLKNLVNKKAKVSGDDASIDIAPLELLLHKFKCGLCTESFDLNEQLIDHLKAKHKGITLRAQYKCGLCSAKFYRNSYLVRHCWHHHAPLCLKTPQGEKSKKIKINRF